MAPALIQSARKRRENEAGQAVVEYVLAILIAISVVSVIAGGFRRIIYPLWASMTRDISAACPRCPADPSIRIR